MRSVADLRPRDFDAVIPALLEHRIAKGPRAVRIRALADRQVRGVLAEWNGLVERGRRGIGLRCTRADFATAHAIDDRLEVRRRGAAASADEAEPVIADECLVGIGEFVGAEGVIRAIGGEDGQAGIRHRGDADEGCARERAQVLAHLARAGRAVEPDHVDAEGLEGGKRRADLCAEQHGPGGLDGHLRDDREICSGGVQGTPRAKERSLRLEQILRGLDQDGIDPALDHARHLDLIRIAQHRERGMAERRQLCAGAH